MKKLTKFIIPLVTLTTTIPVISTLASCNKTSSTDNITLDESTTAQQTTSANLTTATYCFSVSNYSSSTDEIEAEVTDTSTEDDVSIEILTTEFKDGKLYVTVSISKTDGTLNDEEEVSFSINFKCTSKETKADKWSKKIEKLSVKHHITEGADAHFDDTDTVKSYTTENKEAGTIVFNFDLNSDDDWESTLDISKLKVKTYRGIKSLISPIQLSDEATKVEFVSTLGIKQLQVTIGYDTTKCSKTDVAQFGLMFMYNTDAKEETATKWVQTIDGFKVQYGTIQQEHLALYSSRERHFYKNATLTDEASNNYICIAITDGNTYTSSDLEISLNKTERVTIDPSQSIIIPTSTSSLTFPILAIPYTITEAKFKNHISPDWDLQNIALTVKSKQASNEWTQTIKGFTFKSIESKTGTLISHDISKTITAPSTTSEVTLTNFFKTISPFEAKDIMYATIKYPQSALVATEKLDVKQFNVKGTEIAIPALPNAQTGEQSISINILVHTLSACYLYVYKATVNIA